MLTTLQFVADVVDSETILVQAFDLQNNFLDLKDMGLLPAWNSELHTFPLCIKAAHEEQVKLRNLDIQRVCLTQTAH